MKIRLRIESGYSVRTCARLAAPAGAVRVKGTTRGCSVKAAFAGAVGLKECYLLRERVPSLPLEGKVARSAG